ncbi:mechanosensitive ion channel family protein [Rhizobium sp. CSW-27]|uniref:mechanosensitive ion channel family protein n=1 Tax=Rhizobium sp. CSW-27 TaxID=2839985 RepID=UPI002078CAFA|nr:mechanosensitive ion channel family protein [Rhizobium sp. CSW-27]
MRSAFTPLSGVLRLVLVFLSLLSVAAQAQDQQPAVAPPATAAATSAAAAGQEAGSAGNPDSRTAAMQAAVARARAQLAALSEEKSRGDEDDFQLAELKSKADDLAAQLAQHLSDMRDRLGQIQSRITEIGDPPHDGQPAEAPAVTIERSRLLAERNELNIVTSDANQIAAATGKLSASITELRRRLFAEQLLKHTDLSPDVFVEAGEAFLDEISAFHDAMSSWLGFAWKFKKLQLLSAVLLSVGAALVFLVGGYRLFGRMVSRDLKVDRPSYITRLSFAFWSLMVQTASLTAFFASSFLFLVSFNVLRQDVAPIISAFFGFLWLTFFVARLSALIFAPDYPNWRLARVTNRGARQLYWLIIAMSVINGLDYLLGQIGESLNSPVVLTIVKSLTASVLIGLILVAMSFLKPLVPADKDSDGEGQPFPRGIPALLRTAGLALILCVLSGYLGLARFAATQIVLTGAVLVTMYIGILSGRAVGKQGGFARTAFGRYLAERFKLGEVALDQIGLGAGLGINGIALVFGVPLILLTWGFQIQDIQAAAFRLFTRITIGNISISLVGILGGVLLFFIGYAATRWAQGWIDRNVMARSHVDAGVRNSVKTGIGYLGIGLAVVIGVSAAGIDLSSLALVASALSVGIGFGLQNIVSNFVSGLILLVERPFKVGDFIVTGSTEGIVKRISVRATEIETFRKQSIIVPNSELINASVGNWTHRNRVQRSEIPVGVAYDSDPQRVIDILMETALSMETVLRNPEPHVDFLGFGASSLDFELRFYLSDISDGIATRNKVRIEILRRFREEGIEIPYPHQDVKILGTVRTRPADEETAPAPLSQPDKGGAEPAPGPAPG